MTPKEKAQDLWIRYYELIDDDYSNEAAKKIAKTYALIAVDEILGIQSSVNDKYLELGFHTFWNGVKQEIENL